MVISLNFSLITLNFIHGNYHTHISDVKNDKSKILHKNSKQLGRDIMLSGRMNILKGDTSSVWQSWHSLKLIDWSLLCCTTDRASLSPNSCPKVESSRKEEGEHDEWPNLSDFYATGMNDQIKAIFLRHLTTRLKSLLAIHQLMERSCRSMCPDLRMCWTLWWTRRSPTHEWMTWCQKGPTWIYKRPPWTKLWTDMCRSKACELTKKHLWQSK